MNSSNHHSHEHHSHENHSHENHFEHTHSQNSDACSREETLALLSYMIEHNRHHEEELHELSHNLDDEAAKLVHNALDLFGQGNDLLSEALKKSQNT